MQKKEVGEVGWGGKEEETKERKKNEAKNKIKHRKKETVLISYIVLIFQNLTGMAH